MIGKGGRTIDALRTLMDAVADRAGLAVRSGRARMSRKFGDMVAIGRIVKPQGRHGEVVVESFSDVPERFPSLRERVRPRTRRIRPRR